jgi:hypothetical protein
MPRTKKTKISKTKQTKETKSKETITPYQNIINVINSLSNSRNKHSFSKSRNNLPAQLMNINKKSQHISTSTSKKCKKSINPHVVNRTFKSSSSFSSITQNGETHSEGKKVINNSLKPFIEIKEMENGDVQHYMIPRTSLSQSHSNNKKSKSTKRKTIKRKSTKRKTTKRKTIKRKSTKRKTKTSKKSNSKSKSNN